MDRRVADAMQPYLAGFFGNPSSLHKLGRLSRGAIDRARQQVAVLVGASPDQIVFTSGGTEANNLAIKGVVGTSPHASIAIGATEHPSVTEAAAALCRHGHSLVRLSVDDNGLIHWDRLPALLDNKLTLLSVMLANNETGVIQDLAPAVAFCRSRNIAVHSDAVQAVGKMPVDFAGSGVNLMSISGHKIGGPKGIGALVTDHRFALELLLHGGGQEQGLRCGTENVAAIVGFGQAAELAGLELSSRIEHMRALRDTLEQRLSAMPGVTLFAAHRQRLPNTVQMALAGVDGEMLVMLLDQVGIAVSSGSACSSGAGEPSPVLTAMGVSAELAKCAVRISLGPGNTTADIDALIAALNKVRQRCEPVA
jgi:cysteine desulfurase